MQLKIIRIISLIAALLAGLWTINADAAGIGYRDIFVGASGARSWNGECLHRRALDK